MNIKIYYEDTDAGGVVYYANYLKFFERGRTEYLGSLGVSLFELVKNGYLFAVVRAEIDYKSPAVLGDEIKVLTEITDVKRSSFTLRHKIVRINDKKFLTSGIITMVCVTNGMKIVSIPENIKKQLILHIVKD